MPIKNDSPIDFADSAFLVGDRTEAYADLRRRSPVARMYTGADPLYLVSRHQDVRALARRPEARVNPHGTTSPPWLDDGAGRRRFEANLAQTDAPIHTRLRSVIAGQFLPRRVEQLRAISARSAARAIAEVPRDSEFDVVEELALQVPRGVICHLLGIPEADWGALTAVQHEFLLIFSPFPLSPEEKAALDSVSQFYLDYFEDLLNARPADQHTPYVRSLLAAQQQGDLNRTEVLSLMHTVLDAGFETTRTSISNAVELLATVPGVFDELREKPDRITNAVEELLRFRPPIHVRERYLTEDFDATDGTTIPSGAHVFMMLAAANRDESTFHDPDTIAPERPNASEHLAFGGGLHHCLGAPVARIQLQETLKALTETFTGLELGGADYTRHPSLVFPSLVSLPLVASSR